MDNNEPNVSLNFLSKGVVEREKLFYKGVPYTWNEELFEPSDDENWSGQYITEKKQLAIGYFSPYAKIKVGDDWEEDTSKIAYEYNYVLEFKVNNSELKLLTNSNPDWGSVTTKEAKLKLENELFSELEERFNIIIDREKPFIPQLGEKGYCYEGIHDSDGTKELIIPNSLVKTNFDIKTIEKYKFLKNSFEWRECTSLDE